ncbi:MAG: DUF4873 domain-containing protein [Gordonia sp. (in: high G+C Gram-positive bacteria)]|uniref:DUF4873 domain-containing protein n=1 Tax=Gordonia sp. (in: high G+C Gram-positive bacteria) TaxID=84139 RepID=UPI0039E3EEA4
MTTIALIGDSTPLHEVRHRLEASPLPFEVVDTPETADLVVTDAPAPIPNYLGVVSTTAPNRFFVTAPSVGYVVDALTEAHLVGAYGVVVRPPIQNEPPRDRTARRPWRRRRDPIHRFDPVDYEWATEETVDTEVFDDDVEVTVGDQTFTARLRARGYMDTNDGRFHWAGLLHGDQARLLKEDGKSKCTVSYQGTAPTPAKLSEITQWGVVRMTGVGSPPWVAAEDAALAAR